MATTAKSAMLNIKPCILPYNMLVKVNEPPDRKPNKKGQD